jgi:predicted alpha/beta-fold hydrolase
MPASLPAEEIKRRALRAFEGDRFHAAWWLRNAHAQTVYATVARRPAPVRLTPERFRLPDGDALRLWHLRGGRGAPTVLLLHGLEGSARSVYIAGMLASLAARRWNAVAMEFRGCSGWQNEAPRLYHSGETGDVHAVATALRERGVSRLYAVGFSLGGNVTAKWLGEQGDAAPVDAAAVVGAPYELAASGAALDMVLGGFYARRFLATLIPKALAKACQYPRLPINVEALRCCRSIVEYDHHVTAPVHGFADAWDYYARCASGRFLDRVRRPLLLVSAQDDPMNPAPTLPWRQCDASPFLTPLFPRRGGHLGFVAGASPRTARWWAEEQVLRYLLLVDSAAPLRQRTAISSTSGWTP